MHCINFNTLSDCPQKKPFTMVSRHFVSLFLCFLCFEISVSSIRLPGLDQEAKATYDDDDNYISQCPFSIFVSLCRWMPLKFDIFFVLVCGCSFFSHGSVSGLNRGVSSVKFDPTRVTQLSWNPRFDLFLC